MTPHPPEFMFPSPQFAFPRSYTPGFWVRNDNFDAHLLANRIEFTLNGTPDVPVRVTIDERFLEWSSNRWTIDHIFIDCEYYWSPDGLWHNQPYQVGWYYEPGFTRGLISVNAIYGAVWQFVALSSAPVGYWMPEPFPM